MLYKNIKEFSEGHDIETVIPDFPLYNYLYDKRPIFKIDWFLDLESSREPHAYLKEMEGKYFVIREKSFTESEHPKRMILCNLIKENGTLIKKKTICHFIGFRALITIQIEEFKCHCLNKKRFMLKYNLR